MNYLAHIYLSNNDKDIEIGNFIADAVKGSKYLFYSDKVKTGILLHRFIDSYTDSHILHRISKRRLNQKYGHYKGIIIDIFYDHFLAKNWKLYSKLELSDFSNSFYDNINENIEVLPDKIRMMVPYLIKDDWLTSYASKEGIEKVLNGMNRRIKGNSRIDEAIVDLEFKYEEFESDFTLFFSDLYDASNEKLIELYDKNS